MEEEISLMLKSQEAPVVCVTPGDRRSRRHRPGSDPGRWQSWRNGRGACCLGLAPGHRGTGGKVRIGSISKRGNAYLRTLLINGARALASREHPAPWIVALLGGAPSTWWWSPLRTSWHASRGLWWRMGGPSELESDRSRQRVQARCKPVLHDQRRGDALCIGELMT
ncbi:MAG: transposase [Zoogloea sp.]|nr:transposase [Zoogloea sp.]